MVAYSIYNEYNTELVVTSCNDSRHGYGSFHYQGDAVDIRTKNLPDEPTKVEVRNLLNQSLPDFDVVLEGLATDNEHIHIEWHPKGR